MKHDGLIQSDQAEKLYSYPTLSGDSDTFLNGAGDFDHPHVEYFNGDTMTSAYPYINHNYANPIGTYFSILGLKIDKYGHVTHFGNERWRYTMPSAATTSASGLMSAADKNKLDSYPQISSDVSLTFAELELANGNTVSLLAAVPASEG